MEILIIGGEGQLGTSLSNLVSKETFANFTVTKIEDLDLSKEENIKSYFESKDFNYIINCTAYTAVDNAESDHDTARLINARAVQWIGRHAHNIGAKVIHISTDYVYDGENNRPITTKELINPTSTYGRTKAEGEQLLVQENRDSIIIRTSWLYSEYGNNFVKTMLKLGSERDELKVVYDQIGTPTYAEDLALAIIHILKRAKEDEAKFIPGTYHFSNEGVCSWYDFAKMIFKLSDINIYVEPVFSNEFPTVAKRPHYSVLDKSKIKNNFGITIPFWVDSLEKCLKNINNIN